MSSGMNCQELKNTGEMTEYDRLLRERGMTTLADQMKELFPKYKNVACCGTDLCNTDRH